MIIIRTPTSPFHARLTPTPDGTLVQLCENTGPVSFTVHVSEMVKSAPIDVIEAEVREILGERREQ